MGHLCASCLHLKHNMRSTAVSTDGIGVPEKNPQVKIFIHKIKRGREKSGQRMLLKRQEQKFQANGTQSHPNTIGMKRRKKRQTITPSLIGLT